MMRLAALLLSLFLAVGCSEAADSHRPSVRPPKHETDREFALRALQLPPDVEALNLTSAEWNGRRVLFADYSRPSESAPQGEPTLTERPVVALWRTTGNGFERADVTLGEQEGGEPKLAAIGFANADRDTEDELIVMLTWDVRHYAVSGSMYRIVILDDAKPGQPALSELTGFRRGFDQDSCECERRDEPPSHARFRTIQDVTAELTRLGF